MSKLYVGNLSYSTTEDSLKSAFSEDGREVKSVAIITDRETGQPRGFAFVEMASPADAEGAITSMDGREVDGRRLRVNEARERPPRGGGGGPPRGPGGGPPPRGGPGGDRGRGGPRGGRGGDKGRGGGGGRKERRDRGRDSDW